MDEIPDEALSFGRIAASIPGVMAVNSVRSRTYGSKLAAELTILVDPNLTTAESHDIACQVESAIASKHAVAYLTVHVEPVLEDRAR